MHRVQARQQHWLSGAPRVTACGTVRPDAAASWAGHARLGCAERSRRRHGLPGAARGRARRAQDARDWAVRSVVAEGTVSQARLGELLDVNRTVMITVIDRLERAGLVLRER